jgi:dTDP-4-amino-4,6-dideoxygalactose transaminase
MKALMKLAHTRELHVIEDNAQSIGAKCISTHDQYVYAGTIGEIGTTSFYPSKNLGCYGDGGAIFARKESMAKTIRVIANHGMQRRYYHDVIGVNSRLDSIQAAILNVKLPYLDRWNQQRVKVADQYDKLLGELEGILIPQRVPWSDHVFHQYTIRVLDGRRDAMQAYLAEHKIPSMIYYPVPMHEQTAFNKVVRKRVLLKNTDLVSKEVLSLPMHPDLEDDQMQYIAEHIGKFLK